MTISVGSKLPAATLQQFGANGPEAVDLAAKLAGRKVVIFGLPGAYTGTCTTAHLPSFIRTRDKFAAKGVDEVICVAVNDAFVMKAWQAAQNADAITMLADGDGSWTQALGLAKETGAFGGLRAQRFALIANDGVVEQLFVEAPGKFEVSAAESLLAAL